MWTEWLHETESASASPDLATINITLFLVYYRNRSATRIFVNVAALRITYSNIPTFLVGELVEVFDEYLSGKGCKRSVTTINSVL